jgi:hypothetical protein
MLCSIRATRNGCMHAWLREGLAGRERRKSTIPRSIRAASTGNFTPHHHPATNTLMVPMITRSIVRSVLAAARIAAIGNHRWLGEPDAKKTQHTTVSTNSKAASKGRYIPPVPGSALAAVKGGAAAAGSPLLCGPLPSPLMFSSSRSLLPPSLPRSGTSPSCTTPCWCACVRACVCGGR